MGKISESHLHSYLEPRPGGTVVKIGKMATTPPEVTATVITQHDDGYWYYEVAEIELRVWPNRFLEVPLEDGRHLIWMGLEVKMDRRDWARASVAFALEPYSLNWYGRAPLLPAAKTKAHAVRMILAARQKADGDLLRALETVSYDPFETNRQWLTARLKNPMRLHWDGVEPLGDQFAYGRSVNFTYGAKGRENKPHWVFAICRDYERAFADVRREVEIGLSHRLLLEPAEIFDSTLTASIHQALAGRAGGTKPNRVAYPAARIHAKHMDAAAKRSGAAPR